MPNETTPRQRDWEKREREKRKRQPVHGTGVRAIINAIAKRARKAKG